MSKGFPLFSAAAVATGLLPNTLYHVGGKDTTGDQHSGLFLFVPGPELPADNDHIPVSGQGTLIRQTHDLIHELQAQTAALEALEAKTPAVGPQAANVSTSIVPATGATFALAENTSVALTQATNNALASAIDTALRATPIVVSGGAGGGPIDNAALADAINDALRATALNVSLASGGSIALTPAANTALATAIDTALRATPLSTDASIASGSVTSLSSAIATAIDTALRATALNTTATLAAPSVTSLATAIDTALRATDLKVSDNASGHTTILSPSITGTWAALASTVGRSVTIANGRYSAAGLLDDGIVIEVRRVGTTASVILPVGELTVLTVDADANEIELRRVDGNATAVTAVVGVSPFIQKGDAGVTLVNTAAAADVGAAVNTALRATPLVVGTGTLATDVGTSVDTALRATALNTTATLATPSVTALATAIDTALRTTDLKVSDNPAGATTIVAATATGTWAALPSQVGRTVAVANARYGAAGITEDGILLEVRRVGTTAAAVLDVGDYILLAVNANANELEVRRRDGVATAVDIQVTVSPFLNKGDSGINLVNTANPTDIGTAVNTALRATALPTSATIAAASITALSAAIDTALRATPLKTSGPLGGSASAVKVDVTTASTIPVAARATRRYVTLTNPPSNTAKVAYAIGAAATLAGNPNLEPGHSISIQTVDAVQMIADAACKIDVIEVWA